MGCCHIAPQSANKIEFKITGEFTELNLYSDENKEANLKDTRKCSFNSYLESIDNCFLASPRLSFNYLERCYN